MNDLLLECVDVNKYFSKEGVRTDVLKSLNLTVNEGDTLAILGHSGAGKSTLLHLLGALEPPSSGKIYFEGKELQNFNMKKMARFRNQHLGFIFQFHYLLQEFTALENVLMPALIAGEKREAFEQMARELLDEVGLAHRVDHRPGELSGGEQQRVAVARALVMNPKLILADEPTGNLDSENAQNIDNLLLDLNRNRNVTIILVTHDTQMAQSYQRKVFMKDGMITEQH